MIRNDKEYRYSKEQLSELEAELQKLSPVHRYSPRPYAGRAWRAPRHVPAADSTLRAGRVAEDQPVAPCRGRRRSGARCEHPCQAPRF
jgi:hypothetical protein